MLTEQMVRRALERVEGAFDTWEKGYTSELVLAVSVRAQADGLREIEPNAAIALSGLADEIDAVRQQPGKPKRAIRDLRGRFDTWRKDTLAVVGAEARRERETAEARRTADREDLLVRASGMTAGGTAQTPPTPAEDKAMADALAEVEGLAGPPASEGEGPIDAEVEAMSIEEIERILAETRKKL